MKRILVDARYVKTDGYDGISRYSECIINELHKLHPLELLIHDEKQKAKLPNDAKFHMFHAPTSPKEPFSARKLNEINPDVFYSPMQTVGLRGKKFPAVLTLHDLIYYEHPEPPKDFAPHIRAIWLLYHKAYFPQRLLLNSADAVVTVSETSKAEIEKHRLTNKPVEVVYNAVDRVEPPQVPFAQRKNELVYMGSFIPYKNVELLVKAINHLPKFKLRLLSKSSSKVKKQLIHLADNPKQLIFDNGVSDEEYHDILGNAFAAVTASKAEGFGIPIIEAMQVGTPVVCSDIPIFHEIAQDAALFADNTTELAFMEQLHWLQDQRLWEDQRKKGLAQSEKFGWDKSAQKLLTVLGLVF
ncbi:MAG: glycosyltransferase family 1 protein [Micrococcaceae bacterium]